MVTGMAAGSAADGREGAAVHARAFLYRHAGWLLPLAFAVPGAVPVLPAIIVTQTLVELISVLVYIRLIPKLGGSGQHTPRLDESR